MQIKKCRSKLRHFLLCVLSFFHALDVLPVEVVGHHKADANNPDDQQNLPDFHATLPMILWWIVPAVLLPGHAGPRFRLLNHPLRNQPGNMGSSYGPCARIIAQIERPGARLADHHQYWPTYRASFRIISTLRMIVKASLTYLDPRRYRAAEVRNQGSRTSKDDYFRPGSCKLNAATCGDSDWMLDT